MSRGLQPGLGGASNADIDRALEIARDAHGANVMRELQASLDQIMDQPDARTLKRQNVLVLLRAISEGLKPATDRPIGWVNGDMLVRSHPAFELLDEFVDALSDLDRGKTDPSLKAYSCGPNAALTTQERKWDDAVLEAVLVVRRARGFNTRAQAEEFLARNLNAAGKRRRGKPYSGKMLKTLRDDRLKRKSP